MMITRRALAVRAMASMLGAGALALTNTGCGSAIPDASTLATSKHDPTPLAKCHIAANSSAPLVTEWPASEKSHLETLLVGQAVAVEYSGCELRMIDACRIPGKYTWQRTTLATDTVEINDADELYAKLPLGALSLEGELKRSGRLAVRTTVSGQLRLGEVDTSNVSREGVCGRATHVVSAISIGAFKLLGGGGTSARGSAGYMGVGEGGGATMREEQIVREAGDPKACSEATGEAANPLCSSPIQIFLQPIERAKTEEELRAAAEEKDAQVKGGVRVNFATPSDGLPWSLRGTKDERLCGLPCSRWVGPNSGYYLRRDEARASGFKTFDVPSAFEAGAGTTVDAEVKPSRGNRLAAIGAMAGSIGVIVGGVALAVVENRHHCYNSSHVDYDTDALDSCSDAYDPTGTGKFIDGGRDRPLWLGFGVSGLGLAGLVASTYWLFWSHGERLEISAPRMSSGPVRSYAAPNRPHFRMTGQGAAWTF